MKRNILLLSLLSLALYSSAVNFIIKGSVSCNGKGIAGVPVTDGYSVCLTNNKGQYLLNADSKSRFVYISSPAGYMVETDNSVPRFFHALSSDSELNGKIDFQLKHAPTDDTKHGFIVWADPQVKTIDEAQQAKEVAGDVKKLLQKYDGVSFHGLGCGDIVADNPSLYDSIKNMLSPLQIPFYQAIGNHDLYYDSRSNEASRNVYESNFGPDYYSFNRGDIHYVVLNDVFYIGRDYFYIGYLPETQLSWLEKDLSFVEEGKTVVLVLHIPTALDEQDIKQFSYPNISKSLSNKKALYKILEPFNAHIISGHMHVSNNLVVSPTLFEHNVSSVCGAWWQGPFAQDGTPKGYAVFEADGPNLSWYFKSAGFDKGHQFNTYSIDENPEQSGFITVNIWNWDPEWKVFWYENGEKMGEMEQYEGRDPATTKAYADKEKLDYKWLTSANTKHMFRAKPQSPSAKITVEVIDRFGNVYKQNVTNQNSNKKKK
ncbi:MAG: calcineurin-like phosphoesterase C-terminal domain-containing protein [Draconibacterium sp.]